MNVCLLNRYFDFRGIGVTRIAVEVSRELERQGHTVTRLATDGASLYAYAYQTGVRVPFVLPRRDVDVYHALATLEAMWLPKDRSIATFLDLFTTTNPDRAGAGMGYSKWKLEMGRRYFDFGCRLAARCRYLVCISEKTKQDVIDYVHPDESKIVVIRLGISDKLAPCYAVRRQNRFTIGTLSQLDKRKRVDLLIQQFRKSKIDADLLIAGRGPDSEMLAGMAGGDERIKFLGLVPDDDLPKFYNRLDVFVMPTGIEGYGLPMVEAMACAKPVVILDDAIIPEEIRSRCTSVGNLTSFFNSQQDIDAVMNKPVYNGNMSFAWQHRWSKCVGEYVKLYKNIAEGG